VAEWPLARGLFEDYVAAMPTASSIPNAAPDWADDMEQRVLDRALERLAVLGWNRRLVRAACAAEGLSLGDEELLLPNGARDLAALLWRRHDARAMTALAQIDPATLKIRERIARAVAARLEATDPDREATRRLSGFLHLPIHADLGATLTWATADQLWRWAGDMASDWNHYTKRLILSGILGPALTLRLFDGAEAADAYVAARIDNVMTFEKWKAGKDFDAPGRKLTELLSRLRYGAKT
jgi:ubiquinone biosynthesis protein COQ9